MIGNEREREEKSRERETPTPRLRSIVRSESVLKSSFRVGAEKYSQSDYYYAKNDAVVHERLRLLRRR